MRLYIVTAGPGDSRKALGAFSTKERAESHLAGREEAELAIETFDTAEGAQFSTLFVFAIYDGAAEGKEVLIGYYYFKWEAEEAHGDEIRADRLEIDREDDGDEDSEVVAKKSEPTEAEREVAEALAGRTVAIHTRQNYAGVRRRSNSLRKVVIFYVLVVILLVSNILTHRNRAPHEFAENVDSVEWLPAEASAISYYKDDRFNVFEFDIPIAGFQSWAEAEGYKTIDIIGEPLVITRYRLYVDLPVDGAEGMSEEEAFEAWQDLTKAYVFDGLRFNDFDADESMEILGGYDSKNGRAYFKAREVKER